MTPALFFGILPHYRLSELCIYSYLPTEMERNGMESIFAFIAIEEQKGVANYYVNERLMDLLSGVGVPENAQSGTQASA